MPLHSGIRCRLLHNAGGVSGGRGEDALHELGGGAVRQCGAMCAHHVQEGGTLCLL